MELKTTAERQINLESVDRDQTLPHETVNVVKSVANDNIEA